MRHRKVRGQATSWHKTSRGADDEALLCFVSFVCFGIGFDFEFGFYCG
jgi:hypothetical protein